MQNAITDFENKKERRYLLVVGMKSEYLNYSIN